MLNLVTQCFLGTHVWPSSCRSDLHPDGTTPRPTPDLCRLEVPCLNSRLQLASHLPNPPVIHTWELDFAADSIRIFPCLPGLTPNTQILRCPVHKPRRNAVRKYFNIFTHRLMSRTEAMKWWAHNQINYTALLNTVRCSNACSQFHPPLMLNCFGEPPPFQQSTPIHIAVTEPTTAVGGRGLHKHSTFMINTFKYTWSQQASVMADITGK